jgi:hypothetical protein
MNEICFSFAWIFQWRQSQGRQRLPDRPGFASQFRAVWIDETAGGGTAAAWMLGEMYYSEAIL